MLKGKSITRNIGSRFEAGLIITLSLSLSTTSIMSCSHQKMLPRVQGTFRSQGKIQMKWDENIEKLQTVLYAAAPMEHVKSVLHIH